MKANFRFVLRTDHKDKQQRSLLFLRMTSHRKVKYISTGRRIQDRFWNKEREQVRSGHPDAVELNQYLEDFVGTARERFRQQGFDISNVSRKSIVPEVISFIDGMIKEYGRPEQFRTQKKFVTLKNKLIDFTKTNKVGFDRIDKNFILEFDNFLKLSHRNGTNTRVKYIKVLRQTVNRAIEEGVTATPFPKVRLREERGERRRLTIEEIRRLQAYEVPVNSHRWHARNMFLLSFYIGGARFEDVVSLEWKHIKRGSLQFTMGKTGKPYQIGLLPEALTILDLYVHRSEHRYVFPLLPEHICRDDVIAFKKTVSSKNALVNKKLSVIADHLGVEKFSFHCARHSIADYLRLKKVDLYSVSKILRHSNLKTTEIYLRQFDSESVSNEFAKAFAETK